LYIWKTIIPLSRIQLSRIAGIGRVRELYWDARLVSDRLQRFQRFECLLRDEIDDEVDVLRESLMPMQVYCHAAADDVAYSWS
jgi:hypothetical protein